jgi:hypothetical protein
MSWGRRRSDAAPETFAGADLVQRRVPTTTLLDAAANATANSAVLRPFERTEPDFSAPEFDGVPEEPVPPTELIDPLMRLGLSIVLGLGITYSAIFDVIDGTRSLAMTAWRFGVTTAISWMGLWFVWAVWLSYRSRLDDADREVRTAAAERFWIRLEAEHIEAQQLEIERRKELKAEQDRVIAERLEVIRLEAERVDDERLAKQSGRRGPRSGRRVGERRGALATTEQASTDHDRAAVEQQSAVVAALSDQLARTSAQLADDEARRVEASLATERANRVPVGANRGLRPARAASAGLSPAIPSSIVGEDIGVSDDLNRESMKPHEMQAAS